MRSDETNNINCMHGDHPPCTWACPFQLDIRNFTTRIERGRFDAAYRILRNAVLFPGIVSKLCPAPCETECLRSNTDAVVSINQLEKAVCEYASDQAKMLQRTRINTPTKKKEIVIIGGGLGGLACAARLLVRNYHVTLYEKSGQIGGMLWQLLPSSDFLPEIEAYLENENFELRLSTPVESLDDIMADAVYVCTGAEGKDFGLIRSLGSDSTVTAKKGFFIGGSLTGVDLMNALKQGQLAASEINAFLNTGRMQATAQLGRLLTSVHHLILEKNVPNARESNSPMTEDEAKNEAARCVKCDCDFCQRSCAVMSYYKQFAPVVAQQIKGAIHGNKDFYSIHIGKRITASCDQCGILKQDCPNEIDLCTMFRTGRLAMVNRGAMALPFSEFWLEDMRHANSDVAAVANFAPNKRNCRFAFFPGCQMGASNPQYVLGTYRRLLKADPETALLLGCCSAPAYWSGYDNLHKQAIKELHTKWSQLGEPTLILGCPTCRRVFTEFLSEIPVISIWETGLGAPASRVYGEVVSVFDPCSARGDRATQDRIREILTEAGYLLEPLPYERDCALCCSWGGQYQLANPMMAEKIVIDRISLSSERYVTYCTNCRDVFSRMGKPVTHILDVLLGLEPIESIPTKTQRRQNREILRTSLLEELWGEIGEEPMKKSKLTISEEVSKKLDHEWILESDVLKTIEHCESNSQKLLNKEKGLFTGHLQLGPITYWVEYRLSNDGFELINAYSHRMQIKEASEWIQK